MDTKYHLEFAIRRLEVRRREAEAQLDLAHLAIAEIDTDLKKMHEMRRNLRLMGAPINPLKEHD